MKLRPVVDDDRPHRAPLPGDQLSRPRVHVGAGALAELPEHQVTRLPLDQAQDTRASMSGAEYRVRLPMAHLGSRLGRDGPGGDPAASSQLSASR